MMRQTGGHRVRLADPEMLESRIALSHAPRFGAVGDSLADEYRFYPPDRSHARNWVEILAATGKADFGSYTTSHRSSPRGQGYAQDWAESGATTRDVVSTQLAGLAGQVRTGAVQYASVNMGADDFLDFLESAVTTAPPATAAAFASELAAVTATAEANFAGTVSTLLAANPAAKVVVATIPDVREIPLVAQFATNPVVAAAAQAIAGAETAYNDQVRAVAFADAGRVAVADIADQEASYLGTSAKTLAFGGTTLRLTTTGQDYRDFILGDEIHPGTIAQGLIADAEIAAADVLGAAITPLQPAAIVRYARSVAGHFRTAR